MNRINILHVRDSSGIYGAERVILSIGRNLDKSRYRFMLLCMNRENGSSDRLIATAQRLGMHVISVDVRGRVDLSAIRKMRKIIQDNSISLVHSHDFKSNLYSILASCNLKIKRVSTIHGSTRDSVFKRGYLLFDEEVTSKAFDALIAVSEEIGRQWKKKRRLREKVTIIQNGIDLELLDQAGNESAKDEPVPTSPSQKVFAVIGRLYPDKGHRFFLDAFSRLRNDFDNIAGLIIGDGPHKKVISREIEERGLRESVRLCDFRSSMKEVYGNIDVVVIPSVREGLPFVLLEAMAGKIPVIATAVGDVPLLIRDGVTGLLVPPGDPSALAQRMRLLLEKPEKGREMALEGHRLVVEKFSARRMVKETEQVYESLLQLR